MGIYSYTVMYKYTLQYTNNMEKKLASTEWDLVRKDLLLDWSNDNNSTNQKLEEVKEQNEHNRNNRN